MRYVSARIHLGLLACISVFLLTAESRAEADLAMMGDMAVESQEVLRALDSSVASSFLIPAGSPLEVLERLASLPSLTARGACKMRVALWEDGVLPLEFSSRISDSDRKRVLDACEAWSRVADVQCVEDEYKGRSLKVSNTGTGCWALWGMGVHYGVRRRMNLQDGCFHQGILIHELGHAFGLIHEHQRPDRDTYVEIRSENVQSGFFGLNQKVNSSHQDSVLRTLYDFLSIMHYDGRAFSRNGKPTIIAKEPYTEYQSLMGTGSQVSARDAATMVFLYGGRQ